MRRGGGVSLFWDRRAYPFQLLRDVAERLALGLGKLFHEELQNNAQVVLGQSLGIGRQHPSRRVGARGTRKVSDFDCLVFNSYCDWEKG